MRSVELGCLFSEGIAFFRVVNVYHELKERLTEGHKFGSMDVNLRTQCRLIVN